MNLQKEIYIYKKTVRHWDTIDGEEVLKNTVVEESERYIPPNLQALELLYFGNAKSYK